MGKRPSAHRGQTGIDAMYSVTKAQRTARKQPDQSQTPATADPLAGKGGARRGGAGAGCTKPRRADPVRARQVRQVPGQAEALREANAHFFSPGRKLAACRRQRSTGAYDETLPLTPVEERPCETPECHCRMAHQQLARSIPLGSPSQARPPPARPPLSSRLPPPRPRPSPPHPLSPPRCPHHRPATLPTPKYNTALPAQSVQAHHLAGPAGRASRATIEAARAAAKQVRVAAKAAAAAEQEEQAQSDAASALASLAPRGQTQHEAAVEAGTPSGPGGGLSSPRRPCSTGASSSPSPRSGVANLLLAFGDVSPDD